MSTGHTGERPIDATPAGEHMDEQRLLRHITGAATPAEHQAAERHLLLCRECRHALVAAATHRRAERRRRTLRRAVPLASAAIVVLAVGTSLYRTGPTEPVFRGAQSGEVFAALSPAADATVPSDSVVFTWSPADANAYYSITLTDAEGDVLWSARVSEPAADLPESIRLTEGASYYWFVDAFLDGANSATTGVQQFQVR